MSAGETIFSLLDVSIETGHRFCWCLGSTAVNELFKTKDCNSLGKRIKFSVFTQFPVLGGNLTVNANFIFSLNENVVISLLGQYSFICGILKNA